MHMARAYTVVGTSKYTGSDAVIVSTCQIRELLKLHGKYMCLKCLNDFIAVYSCCCILFTSPAPLPPFPLAFSVFNFCFYFTPSRTSLLPLFVILLPLLHTLFLLSCSSFIDVFLLPSCSSLFLPDLYFCAFVF